MKHRMRVLGVTLARGGSKNIPKKNITPINGVPLIAYTIIEALKSDLLTRYIVSTDDQDIMDVASRYGAETPFKRPDCLSADDTPSVDALKHAVQWTESDEGQKYDIVIELMCTNPLKTSEDIDTAVSKLQRTGADSVIGVSKLEHHHPMRIKKIVGDRIEEFGPVEQIGARRQDLQPEAYIRNGSIFAMQRNRLIKDGLRYGHEDSRPLIMPESKSIDIDTMNELKLAELILNDKYENRIRELKNKS